MDQPRRLFRRVIRGVLLTVVGVPVGLFVIGALTAFRTAYAEPKDVDCGRPVSPEEMQVDGPAFEAILIDKWTDLVPGYDGFLRIDNYRFQVVREWAPSWYRKYVPLEAAPPPRRELQLTHHFLSSYVYRSFDVGHRYLVFPISHDSPAQLWASPCAPGAEGDDIPALADRLGPPYGIFDVDEQNLPQVSVWTKLGRHARNALGIALQPILPALAALDSVL
jgi:hypothetical protein